MNDGRSFTEYMRDIKEVNRWLIVKVFLAGMFAGALLTVAFTMTALR